MWDRNPVRTSLVHMLPTVADRHGLPLPPLLTKAGLPPEEAFTGDVVARAQICTLLAHLAQQAGDPTIGLDLGAMGDPALLGMTGHALFAGRTLRECLAALARQMPSLQGGVALWVDERDGVARWGQCMADSDRGHARVLNEGVAAFMAKAVRAIAGMEPEHLGVSLPHRAQAPIRVYEDKLASRLSFGTGDGVALTFDAAWLDRPNLLMAVALPETDAGRPDLAHRVAGDAVWRDDEALLGAVLRLVEGAALSGALGLADTARSLGISPRSLQRRLAGLGTSFEACVDEWRHRQARRYLMDAELPVGSIGRALGYSHPAHFVRAFRRWEGHTPLSFRRAARAGGGAGSQR
ncbi:AraC family transcriptional regulator ligand-binding domain-containing protein [Xanthobacter versatilis]|uniref:AraC family transcriptional regulator ligand-binding domain-containing protein n=1 Tax=Xanthobacter autotrophicus (strain ATCC BAA-1158 / Py2) TaxID=78245 RepID=UPI00372CCE98